MTKLIRTDLTRVLKDKLFMVTCIIGGAFALFTPLLLKLLFGGLDATFDVMTDSYVSPKSQFFNAFSPGNNFGMIVPVLLGIILYKDFTFGTVRNKIISGNTRTAIFLSMFTVCFIVLWCVVFAYALLILLFNLVLFGAGDFPVSGADVLYFFESVCFELLLYLFIAAFISWLCACMKNVGLVIVMYVAAVMIFTIIAGILQISAAILAYDPDKENVVRILEFFQRINVFYSYSYIGTGSSYALSDALYLTLPPLIGAAGFIGWGTLKFNKKDLK